MLVSNIILGFCLPCIIPDMCGVALDFGLSLNHLVDVFFRESSLCVEVAPQLTALSHVSCTGLNAAACRYLMALSFPLTLWILLLWCVGISRLWRGTLHKPVIVSLVTCNIILSYLVTAMVCWLKLVLHPASHNFLVDMREICASPGIMWAYLSLSVNFYNAIRHPLVDLVFGHLVASP